MHGVRACGLDAPNAQTVARTDGSASPHNVGRWRAPERREDVVPEGLTAASPAILALVLALALVKWIYV